MLISARVLNYAAIIGGEEGAIKRDDMSAGELRLGSTRSCWFFLKVD
jgi:hypothetical protein